MPAQAGIQAIRSVEHEGRGGVEKLSSFSLREKARMRE